MPALPFDPAPQGIAAPAPVTEALGLDEALEVI